MSKYNRTYHLPWSPGTTSDDRISKSVDTLLGIDIVITEKLDGENCGMINGGVYARSHATYTESPWSREVREIHKKIGKHINNNVYIFGENMEGIHSIQYSNLKSYYYIFGVRDNNIWIPWEQVEEYAYLLDIPTVPVLFKGVVNTKEELQKIVEDLVKQPSELGGEREGIVVRNASLFHNDDFSQSVMKWVRRGHVQTDEHWTRNWKKAKINY
jgi:hypothetical protein